MARSLEAEDKVMFKGGVETHSLDSCHRFYDITSVTSHSCLTELGVSSRAHDLRFSFTVTIKVLTVKLYVH